MSITAAQNDTVTVHYCASTRDGGVIEDTNNRKPLVFSLDDETFLESFRQQIVGMEPGETKTILLDPEQSFGLRDHRRQLTVPVNGLPSGIHQGDQLATSIGESEVNVWVVQINGDEATLDTNHPLAGETLKLTIELVAINR